jgi:hypothetical protein
MLLNSARYCYSLLTQERKVTVLCSQNPFFRICSTDSGYQC